jgi:hypothetical protein
MNKLNGAKRSQIVAALVEGKQRSRDLPHGRRCEGTVLNLRADLGAACERYQAARSAI